VIAADFSPRRRAEAERMGADIIVDPAVEGPHGKWADYGVPATEAEAHIARMAGKLHARPIVFECVGVPGMVQRIIEDCPPGAQIVVAGVCMEPDSFRPSMAITKQLNLEFVYGYTPDEFAATLREIAEGTVDVGRVITGTVGLDGVPQAFTDLGDPENHVKIMVDPAIA
jgi:threonine dehydrogenase-like Zn-dependent dehydrogenase